MAGFEPGHRRLRQAEKPTLRPYREGNMRIIVGLILFSCATILPVAAASLEERMAPCLACHGEKGQSETPEVPSLGALPSPYVVIQLYMFRDKLRVVELMNALTKDFTNEDLQQFADSIAKMPAPKPADAPDPARMERGRALVQRHRCGFCHGADFAGHDNIPRIAAQREDYLAKTLREYKSNTRPGYDASMADVVQPLSDADIGDLAYVMAHSP
jgi:cytochrome c553